MGSMGTELVETFEVAWKVADAVGAGAGVAEVDRCVDVLKRLREIPVTVKGLQEKQIGRRLRVLTKHSNEKIKEVASDLLQLWKKKVLEESARSIGQKQSSQGTNSLMVEVESESRETVKVEKTSNAGAVKTHKLSKQESSKVGKMTAGPGIKVGKVSKTGNVKVEEGNGGDIVKAEGTPKEENMASVEKQSVSPMNHPQQTAIERCNDPARGKLRGMLAEAFARVSEETKASSRDEVKNIWDEVEACDLNHVAVSVECAMFKKLGPSTGVHKMKYRSIMFNLKDSKNPDLRRRVLLGHVHPEKLVEMTTQEMASDERKLSNQMIKEKALFDCERGGAPKATTDQFKCGRCGQRKTTYYQMQTRSADEPMTTYVTCVNCNNHWKFC